MEPIKAVAERALTTSRMELSPPAISSRRIDADNLPPAVVEFTDVAIPKMVWSAWIPAKGGRALIRVLADVERTALLRRQDQLAEALLPFGSSDGDRVAKALGGLFDSYPSMRESGAPAIARIRAAMETLYDLPAWTIEAACLDVRRRGYEVVESGRVHFERHWPPSGAEIHAVAEKLTAVRKNALVSARALLAAPVEDSEPPPRPSKEEVEAQIAEITAKANRERAARGDGGYMARVEADLARRRAERESGA